MRSIAIPSASLLLALSLGACKSTDKKKDSAPKPQVAAPQATANGEANGCALSLTSDASALPVVHPRRLSSPQGEARSVGGKGRGTTWSQTVLTASGDPRTPMIYYQLCRGAGEDCPYDGLMLHQTGSEHQRAAMDPRLRPGTYRLRLYSCLRESHVPVPPPKAQAREARFPAEILQTFGAQLTPGERQALEWFAAQPLYCSPAGVMPPFTAPPAGDPPLVSNRKGVSLLAHWGWALGHLLWAQAEYGQSLMAAASELPGAKARPHVVAGYRRALGQGVRLVATMVSPFYQTFAAAAAARRQGSDLTLTAETGKTVDPSCIDAETANRVQQEIESPVVSAAAPEAPLPTDDGSSDPFAIGTVSEGEVATQAEEVSPPTPELPTKLVLDAVTCPKQGLGYRWEWNRDGSGLCVNAKGEEVTAPAPQRLTPALPPIDTAASRSSGGVANWQIGVGGTLAGISAALVLWQGWAAWNLGAESSKKTGKVVQAPYGTGFVPGQADSGARSGVNPWAIGAAFVGLIAATIIFTAFLAPDPQWDRAQERLTQLERQFHKRYRQYRQVERRFDAWRQAYP